MEIKKIAKYVFFLILIIISVYVIYYLINSNSNNQKCKQIKINIKYKTEKPIITENYILQVLKISKTDSKIVGKPFSEIKIKEMVAKLRDQSAIESANAYADMSANLIIEVEQKEPVLLVMSDVMARYYLDHKAQYFKVEKGYYPRILVATGNINHTMDKKLYSLASFVNNNTFWNSNITQLFVNDNQELGFVPLLGECEVIIGDTLNLEQRFKNLETFYQKGLNKIGWNKYKKINISINNQIICN